jgi:phosphomannomutase
MGLIATHSGLRGRPGVELTDAVVTRAVSGFVELLHRRSLPARVALGRDARPAGVALAALASRVLLAHGVEVTDFGVVSTPTAKLGARVRGLGGAVIVTGSHLAPDWNGLKFVTAPHYDPVDVRDLPLPGASEPPRGPGWLRVDDGAPRDHADAVCASIDAALVRRTGLRVVCTGGAGPAAALVLERLGCKPPGPGCDLGLLMDADGDRLRLIDEAEAVLDEEVTFALVVLARQATHVIRGADTSRMVDDLVAACGGSVRVVPPGELHLVGALRATGGDLAGEGNGGVIVPSVGMARDALAAAASILELRARSGDPVSRLAAGLPRYARRRSTVPCPGDQEAMAMLRALGAELGVALDAAHGGLRVERPHGSWGLVRRSATEPLLRVTVEARTEAEAERLHRELRGGLVRTASGP